MRALSEKMLGRLHFTLEQVQDLTPTPMTLSSVMFYTGENPYTHESVYVARTQEEKRRQKSYFFNCYGSDSREEFSCKTRERSVGRSHNNRNDRQRKTR